MRVKTSGQEERQDNKAKSRSVQTGSETHSFVTLKTRHFLGIFRDGNLIIELWTCWDVECNQRWWHGSSQRNEAASNRNSTCSLDSNLISWRRGKLQGHRCTRNVSQTVGRQPGRRKQNVTHEKKALDQRKDYFFLLQHRLYNFVFIVDVLGA